MTESDIIRVALVWVYTAVLIGKPSLTDLLQRNFRAIGLSFPYGVPLDA
jgi:hypothetical protein